MVGARHCQLLLAEPARYGCFMIGGIALPEDLVEPYSTALRLALDFVFGRSSRPLAVTLSGSVVRGHGDPHSDLDLWIVVEGKHRQRVQKRLNGVPCEMFFNPEHRVHRYFSDEAREGAAPSIGLTLDGLVLYDPDGVAERLRGQALRVREAGPQVPPEEVVLRKYLAGDMLDNARDVSIRDPLMAGILTATAVKSALQLAYILAGTWIPRDKDLWLRLDEVRPHAVQPVKAYALDPSPDAAAAVLESIMGISGFFEWESVPDSH